MIYSASNFLLGISVARIANAEDFGYFSIAYLVVVFFITVSRAVSGQPMTLLFAGVPHNQWINATTQMLRFVSMFGSVLGVISIVVGLLLSGSASRVFLAVGVVTPLVLMQDAYRFAMFSDNRRAGTVVADAIWLSLQAAGTVALSLAEMDSPTTLLLMWGVSGGLSAVWAGRTIGAFAFSATEAKWRDTIGDLWRPLFLDSLLQEFPRQAAGWAVTATGGSKAIGSLRGAEVLYGPVTTTAGGARLAFVPIASSRVRDGKGSGTQEALTASIVIGIVAVSMLALWAAVPDSLGRLVLGTTWPAASELVPVLGISLLLQGLGVGGQIRLLARTAVRSVARRRGIVTTLYVVGSVLGAVFDGALGAVIGLACANAIGLVVWWLPVPGNATLSPVEKRDLDSQQ